MTGRENGFQERMTGLTKVEEFLEAGQKVFFEDCLHL